MAPVLVNDGCNVRGWRHWLTSWNHTSVELGYHLTPYSLSSLLVAGGPALHHLSLAAVFTCHWCLSRIHIITYIHDIMAREKKTKVVALSKIECVNNDPIVKRHYHFAYYLIKSSHSRGYLLAFIIIIIMGCRRPIQKLPSTREVDITPTLISLSAMRKGLLLGSNPCHRAHSPIWNQEKTDTTPCSGQKTEKHLSRWINLYKQKQWGILLVLFCFYFSSNIKHKL